MLTENKYKYTIGDLLVGFEKAGLKVSQSWIYRQERRGKLLLPRSTTNIKHPAGIRTGAVRILTKKQIHEIIKAFMPGGSGKWLYKRGKIN